MNKKKKWFGREDGVSVLANPDWSGEATIQATVDGFVRRWVVLADELVVGLASSDAPPFVLSQATAIAAAAKARVSA
jgi:hypothetical protein